MRVPKSILTFLLDASTLNAHAFLNAMNVGSDVLFVREFKRRVTDALMRLFIELHNQRTTLRNVKNSLSGNNRSKSGDDHLL